MAASSTGSPIPSWRPASTSCTDISESEHADARASNRQASTRRMPLMKRLISLTAIAVALGCGAADAQYTDGTIKIGVLNDMSGTYSDLSGQGSVVAARMAVEDFGAARKGM